jgi:glycine dehydrogenase subunit 2
MAARSGLELQEPLVFERGSPGRRGVEFPCGEAPEADDLPESLRRSSPLPLPEVSELEAVRHFTRLSRMNYAVDLGMYPLGSCTMKYNPKVCEDMASLAGFAGLHPLAPDALVQGALEVFALLEAALAEISGMSAVSLLPAAGAHGEWTGIKVIRAALEARGNPRTPPTAPIPPRRPSTATRSCR